MPEPAPPDWGFYVGYLRTPRYLVRFLAILCCLLLLTVDGVALLLYRIQERRPSGDWGTTGEVAYDGVLVARPYPVVLIPATASQAAQAVLLVEAGKQGAPADLARLDGMRVTVEGYPLLRDGLTVLQLSRHPHALPHQDGSRPAAAVELGRRTLTGEVADSKCFLGAMNPGEGKVHAGCASLCLFGDIPPLLVTRDGAGHRIYRMLADATGGPIAEAAAYRAGETLTLTGELWRLDGIEIFSVPAAELD